MKQSVDILMAKDSNGDLYFPRISKQKYLHPGQGFERGPLTPKSRDLPLDQIDPQENL